MKIDGILSEIREITQQPDRKAADGKQRSGAARSSGDQVQISKDARTLKSQQESAVAVLKETPDVRQARVEQVKARVAEKFYDRPEVREAIAGTILDSGVMNEVASEKRQVDTARSVLKNVPDVREDRVAKAKRDVANGTYDTPKVREQTAGKLIDHIVG